MGGHTINGFFFFLMALQMGFFLSAASSAHHKTHIVGGSYGWRIPNTTTFYQEWAQTKRFAVGDKLVFLFTTMIQNVVEIPSAEDFAACQQKNVIDIHFVGPTILELTESGSHYYFCSIGLHCEDGQKLSIDVSSTPHSDVFNTVEADALLAPLPTAVTAPSSSSSSSSSSSAAAASATAGGVEYGVLVAAGLGLHLLRSLFM